MTSLVERAALHMNRGETEQAVGLCRAALAQGGDAPAHAVLAEALRRLGRIDEARAEATAALRRDPGNSLAHRCLAWLDWDGGERERAAARLAEILRQDRADGSIVKSLMVMYDRLERPWDGLATSLRAIAGDGLADGPIRKDAARLARRLGFLSLSADLLQRDLDAGSGDAETSLLLGKTLSALGRPEALGHLRHAAAAWNGPPIEWWAMAAHAGANGDAALAADCAERALRLHPVIDHPGGVDPAPGKVVFVAPLSNRPPTAFGYDLLVFDSSNNGVDHLTRRGLKAATVHVDRYDADNPAFAAADGAAVVVNCVVNPDLDGAALARLRAYLRRQDRAVVINHPDHVGKTARDVSAALLAGIDGLVVPRQIRVAAADPAAAVRRAGLRLPAIVRPIGSQTGHGMALADDLETLCRLVRDYGGAYVAEFVDYRDGAGLYWKTRFFLVDGEPYPEHHVAADHWNVHTGNSRRLMAARPDLQERERRFLADWRAAVGERGVRALRGIAERYGLEYFGVDCAVLPHGGLLLFEANASMRVIYMEAEREWRYLLPHLDRIGDAFVALLARRAPA